jgi:hypothetical protein
LTRNWPKYENYHIIQNFYKEYVLLLIRSAVLIDLVLVLDGQMNQSLCGYVVSNPSYTPSNYNYHCCIAPTESDQQCL